MPTITTGQTDLYYETLGNPEDPAVVLIMGLATQMTAWPEAFCQTIANSGYHVIRFDNRDVGLSQKHGHDQPNLLKHLAAYRLGVKVRAPYTLHDMARDTLGLLDALQIAQAHLVGISMGGMIAQIIAATAQHRTRSLISMMSTSGARHLPLPNKRVLWHMLRRPKHADPTILLKHAITSIELISGSQHKDSRAEIQRRIEAGLARAHYPLGFFRQAAAILATGDRSTLLSRITAPTLVIHGKEDPLSPIAGGIDTAKKIPGAQLALIDGLGHTLPQSIIPTLNELVVGHITEVDRTP